MYRLRVHNYLLIVSQHSACQFCLNDGSKPDQATEGVLAGLNGLGRGRSKRI